MISALHLIWIIPATATLCMLLLILFIGANKQNIEYDMYQQGYIDGKNFYKNRKVGLTLYQYFTNEFNNDFDKFKDVIGEVIYKENIEGQLYMIFIDNLDELKKYFEYKVVNVTTDGQYQRPIIRVNV
jgi:hypothetical protein